MRRELTEAEQKKEAMEYTVAELMQILVEQGGTAASFVFRGEDGNIIATVGVGIYEDAYRLKNLFKDNFENFDSDEE
jgi:hypothetical protein